MPLVRSESTPCLTTTTQKLQSSLTVYDDLCVPKHLQLCNLENLSLANKIAAGAEGTVWALKDKFGTLSKELVFKQLVGSKSQEDRLLRTMTVSYGTHHTNYPMHQRREDVEKLRNITKHLGVSSTHTGIVPYSDLKNILSDECFCHIKSGVSASLKAFQKYIPYLNKEVGVPMLIEGKFGLLLERVNDFTSFGNLGAQINESNYANILSNLKSLFGQLHAFLEACKKAGVMHWDFHCQNFGVSGNIGVKQGCQLSVIDTDSVSPDRVRTDGGSSTKLSDPLTMARLLIYFLDNGLSEGLKKLTSAIPENSTHSRRYRTEFENFSQKVQAVSKNIRENPQASNFKDVLTLLKNFHQDNYGRPRSFAFIGESNRSAVTDSGL